MSRRPAPQPKAPNASGRSSRSTNQDHTDTANNSGYSDGYMSQSEAGAFLSEVDYSDARPSTHASASRSTQSAKPKQPPSRRPQATTQSGADASTTHFEMSDSHPTNQSHFDKLVSASDDDDIFREGFDPTTFSAINASTTLHDHFGSTASPFDHPSTSTHQHHQHNQQHQQHQQRPTASAHSTSAFHANSSSLPFGLIGDDSDIYGNPIQLTADERNEVNRHLVDTYDFSHLNQFPQAVLESQVKSRHILQIQNIVAVVDLKCEIDLKKIVIGLRNSEYNPRRFLSVIIRLRDPKVTGLLFQSGKLVLTGSRTEAQTHLGARKIARLVQKLGHPDVTFNDFQFTNIVGFTDVRFPIDLQHLILKHPQYCEFDPEIFPALVYRVQQPQCSLSVFVNGKVLITGARTRGELYQAFEIVYPVLCEFKKGAQVDSLGAPASAFDDAAQDDDDDTTLYLGQSGNDSLLIESGFNDLGMGYDDD